MLHTLTIDICVVQIELTCFKTKTNLKIQKNIATYRNKTKKPNVTTMLS